MGVIEVGSSCYLYTNEFDENEQIEISVMCYDILRPDGLPSVIVNYCISYNASLDIFATIVWDEVEFKNNDYDIYNYDPDPIYVIYRDDFPLDKIDKYFFVIGELCNKFYEPTTHYKHFNPDLPKIAISNFNNKKYNYAKNAFIKFYSMFINYNQGEDEDDDETNEVLRVEDFNNEEPETNSQMDQSVFSFS